MNNFRRIPDPFNNRDEQRLVFIVGTDDGKFVANIHTNMITRSWIIDGPDDMLRTSKNLFLYEEEMVDALWERWLQSERRRGNGGSRMPDV